MQKKIERKKMDVKKILFAVNGSIFFMYLLFFISLNFENINKDHHCSSTFVAFIVPYRNRLESSQI